jgi:hypothetical protein
MHHSVKMGVCERSRNIAKHRERIAHVHSSAAGKSRAQRFAVYLRRDPEKRLTELPGSNQRNDIRVLNPPRSEVRFLHWDGVSEQSCRNGLDLDIRSVGFGPREKSAEARGLRHLADYQKIRAQRRVDILLNVRVRHSAKGNAMGIGANRHVICNSILQMQTGEEMARKHEKDEKQMHAENAGEEHRQENDRQQNPPRTTSKGWLTTPKFGSSTSGGGEIDPGPERD